MEDAGLLLIRIMIGVVFCFMAHKNYSAGLADTGLKEPDNGSSQLG